MQFHPSQHSVPMTLDMQPALNAPILDVETLIHMTSRLAHILVVEIECLKGMRIQELAKMQPEKNKLITTLEAMRYEMDNHPEWVKELDSEEKEHLREISRVFQDILRENLRHLKVAYQVNQDVISAVREALMQNSQSVGVYNQRGKDNRAMLATQSLSMTINDTV